MGEKDDMLVFDRCGQLTYQLRLPYSYLKHPFVKAAIKATYNGFDQCDCVEVEVEEVVKVVEVVEVEEVVGTTDISVTELVTETPESTTENIITTEAGDNSIPVAFDRNDALLEKHSEHSQFKLKE